MVIIKDQTGSSRLRVDSGNNRVTGISLTGKLMVRSSHVTKQVSSISPHYENLCCR